MPVSQSSWCHE